MLAMIIRSLFILVLALAGTLPAHAEMSPAQKAEIRALIKDYLLENPEIIRDAINELDNRQKAAEVAARQQFLSKNAGPLLNSSFQGVVGNPKGKVTLVEFFDYNCGYCKKTLDDIAQLTKSDPDLRIVLKDFPVLGPGSIEAAQVASAVRSQFSPAKFWEFHQKLLTTRGQIGKAQALSAAKDLGADMGKLDIDMAKPDIRKGIDEVMWMADNLGLTGTPSFVLGDDVIIGAVGYEEIRGKIDNMHKCGKSACS